MYGYRGRSGKRTTDVLPGAFQGQSQPVTQRVVPPTRPQPRAEMSRAASSARAIGRGLLFTLLWCIPSLLATAHEGPAPQYWLVRTYGLGDPGVAAADLAQLDVQRWEADQWSVSSVTDLAATTADCLTVVYVHGNRGDDASAIEHGRRIGAHLAEQPGGRPFQVLIWSWPSAQTQRGRKDFRAKAERTDTEAWYLGTLLDRFDARAEVALIGYSYGARVITGALHWRAGGEYEGRTLPPREPEQTLARYRVALLAPALHQDWLATAGTHGDALRVTQRMLIFYNPCDPALRWYRFVYRCEKPEALGRWGIADHWLGDGSERVEQWDVSPVIGRTHDEDAYLGSLWITERLGETLLPPATSPTD